MTEPTAAANTAVYGTISEFDGDKEEWDEYTERLEEYFEASGITEDAKKRAILLTVCGASPSCQEFSVSSKA